jgi:hypothetical protein
MKTNSLFRELLALVLLIFLVVPTTASAQYIFLDLTGDGNNTAADVLSGSLPVSVDVYLATDRNRDGSPAVCPLGGQPLSIVSYEFILRAVGGSVLWGTFSGTALGGATQTAHNATDLYVGSFPTTPQLLPPGRIRLGTIQVTPLVGTPLLSFAASTPLKATYLTSFGSECRGEDADNTMKLGKEWFDASGTFGPLVANVGGTVFLDQNGTSPGACAPEAGEPVLPGWIVNLSPGGLTVLSSRLGRFDFSNVPAGTYTLQAAPVPGWTQTCPPGGLPQVITVAPNQTYPNLNFGVRPVNSPPALLPIPNSVAVAGLVTNVVLTAADPDANPLTFKKVGGPSFASVSTIGALVGNLRLAPLPSDVGSYMVAVAATDGVFASERTARVNVLSTTAVALGGLKLPGKLAVKVSPTPNGSAASLSFRTAKPGPVRVMLYDIRGRLVRVLLDRPADPAGDYEIKIEGRDGAGRPLASGIYFFKVETSDESQVGRAIMLR